MNLKLRIRFVQVLLLPDCNENSSKSRTKHLIYPTWYVQDLRAISSMVGLGQPSRTVGKLHSFNDWCAISKL